MDNAALNAARLVKLLDKRYWDGDEVVTLREYLRLHPTTRKSTMVQEYTSHRVNLCYEKLAKPKTYYTVWHVGENGREVGIDVPELVWDTVEA